MKLYLSLGSNLGDREANLTLAISKLDEYLGIKNEAISSIMETSAWGFDGKAFLNCAVRYETELDAYEILKICKRIEREMGRVERIEYNEENKRIYHNRIIDIDMILYGDLTLNTPELSIPHPLMKEREFVMLPLMEIIS